MKNIIPPANSVQTRTTGKTILNLFTLLISSLRCSFTTKMIVLVLMGGLLGSLNVFGQAVGDYRSNATGTWNWTTTANWQKYDGTGWINCSTGDYPGSSTGTGTVTISGNTQVILDASVNCNIIIVNATGTLTISAGSALSVQNGIQDDGTITIASTSSLNGQIYFLTNNQSIKGTGFFNLDGTATIGSNVTLSNELATGTAFSITGTITGTDATSVFVNKGLLNDSHSSSSSFIMPTGQLNFSTNGNTVRYSDNSQQDILSTTYYNLTLCNATKTITGNTTVQGNINSEGANARLGNSSNLKLYGTANNFTLSSSKNIVGSTISYLSAGDQPIVASTYYQNIEIGGSGTKSLAGATTVNGTLMLTSGILQLGSYDLTLASATTITGTFSKTNMIASDGTGNLIRKLSSTTSDQFNGIYPVGSGGYYNPLSISGLPASGTATTFSVKSVSSAASSSMMNALKQYWVITTDVITNSSTVVSLQYDNTNVSGTQSLLQPYINTSGSWTLATGASAAGVNPATSTGASTLSGSWTVCATNPVTITGTFTNICKPVIQTYTATTGFSTYNWTITGGSITSGTGTSTITVQWTTDATKNIALTVADAAGFSSLATQTVTSVPTPTENLSWNGTVQTSVCPGTSNVVYAIKTPTYSSWEWNVSTGGSQTPDNSTYSTSVNFDAAAPAVVTLKVYDINTCGEHGPELSQAITVSNIIVYAQADGEITTTTPNWNTAANGTGTVYTYSATSSAKVIYNTNGKNITVNTSPISVAGIRVEGGSLTVNQPITYSACGSSVFYISATGTVTLNNYIDASAGTSNIFTMDGTINGSTPPQMNVSLSSSTTHASDFLYGFSARNFNGGTVTYNGTLTQIIAPYTYPALVLAGSSEKQLAKAITINGDLTINSGTTLKTTTEEGSVNLLGNWVDNGTFNTNSFDSPVTLSNTTINQNIKENGSFKNLIINKSAITGTTVTLTGNLTIAGYLNFAGPGILKLNTSNLILNAGAYIDANGDKSKFNTTRMIEVTGSTTNSLVIKYFDPTADLKTGNYYEFFAPIGNTGKYTPMNLRPLLVSGSFPAGRSISVTTLPLTDPGDPNWVKRQWVVNSTFNEATEVSNAYLNFNYDGATELAGKPTLVRNGGTTISNGFSILGSSNIYSFGTTSGNTKINGIWTCYGTSASANKYYSVKAGAWEDPTCWSTNYVTPAAGSQPAAGGPNNGDEVVIRAGANITKDPTKNKTVTSVEIEAGAILDLGNMTSSASLTVSSYLSGQGTLRLSSPTLPTINDGTQFVSSTGGTIEYYGSTDYTIDPSKAIYNNLVFSGTSTKTIKRCTATGNTYTLNGTLEVTGGIVLLDQTTTANGGTTGLVNLTIDGDFNVRTGATFTVGSSFNYSTHEINLYGNFLNDGGTVNLTSNTSTNYTSPTLYNRNVTNETKSNFNLYNTTADQLIQCNGSTRFYRINMDKGNISQKLTIKTNNTDNFHLMGINNQTDNDGGNWNSSWAQELKALSMQHGTCIIGDNIKIYDLIYSCARNYRVNDDVNFTIDGNNAFVDVCIFDADGGNSTLMLYGKLTVNNGEIHAYYSKGVEIWGLGQVAVNGGILRAANICAPSSGTMINRGAFEMNGGAIYIDGVMNSTGSTGNRGYQRLGLVNTTQSFIMTGGTMYVYDQYLRSSSDLIKIGADPNNAKVTGGNIIIYYNNNDASYTLADVRGIYSTVPLWNLSIYQMQGSSSYVCRLDNDLTILNNLELKTYTNGTNTYSSTMNCNSKNVSVGGNLTVESASAFTNTATFTFNGTTSALQNINLATNPLAVTNMVVNNIVTNGKVMLKNNNITVSSNLTLTKGTLDDNGNTITVSGNIANSATHTSSTSGGGIVIGGTGTQCAISGDGTGTFGNLILSRPNGALTSAKQTITGTLSFITGCGLFSIASNNLTFTNVSSTPVSNYYTTRYINTNGYKSDGGVTYQSGGTVLNLFFPVGAYLPSSTTSVYMPFKVDSITSSVAGSVNIRPVTSKHRLAGTDALSRFWAVTTTGYDNPVNFRMSFTSDATFTSGWMPARIREGEVTWTTGTLTPSPAVGPTFQWRGGGASSMLDGEYTCGSTSSLSNIIVYTSNGSLSAGGDWSTPSTWIKTIGGVVNTDAPLTPTVSNCRVIITANDSVYVTSTAGLITIGALQIADNARLNLGTTLSSYAHDFGSTEKIGGRGKLLISYNGGTIRFPQGDFGNFLGVNGGTVEYYTSGAAFSIPTTNATYYNLIINKRESADRTITVGLPSLTIYNNLSVLNTSGSNTLTAAFTATPITANITGSLAVGTNATMTIVPNASATITVGKNITNKGTLSCTNTNASGLLSVYGNITNSGTLTLYNTGNYVLKSLGTNSSLFSGPSTGTATLYRIIVDKTLSSSRDTMLEVTAPFSLGSTANGALATKPLVLTYGTYKHNTSSPISINSGAATSTSSDFVINSNSRLWINNGTVTVDASPYSSNSVNYYSGISLAGKLYVTGGSLNVYNSSNNYENYIQYTGGSTPEIEVTGGKINVGSQLRRYSDNVTGALVYKQSGGAVNLATQGVANALRNRGAFEVCNDGQFIMTGGTLSIYQGLNNSIPDFYIETSIASSLTPGGFINWGNPNRYTDTDTIKVRCNQSLPNVRISNNKNTGVTSEVKIGTYPLVITGNLTIADSAKMSMSTNNLNLSIAGDFNMNTSGNYDGLVNTTYLNGTAAGQTLTAPSATPPGIVSFYNLQVSNTSNQSVKLAGSGITVKNDLTLDQGTFDLQTNPVHLYNNLIFNAGKSTNTTGGYISFDNASYMQYVNGNAGEVGDIRINNAKNVRLGTNLTAHKGITFTQGYLDVDQYDLSIESTTAFNGTPSKTSKIRTPGTINGGKVIMQFNGNSGAALSSKVVPVGAQDRYTPVTITTGQSDNGPRLEIKPVFAPDPYIVDVAASQALQYYWMMKASTGYTFLNTSSISFVFQWDDSPSAMALGNLADYQPACLHNSKWCLFSSGVDPTGKTITFSGLRADTLDGDYTAGAKPAFTIVPTIFNSVQTGNLYQGSTWDQHGLTPGKGDIIQINNTHIVTFDKSMLNLSATYIDANGELDIPTTSILNNLGTVKGATNGTGTLSLINTGMQDGSYDDFFSSTGGTLEYRNNNTASMNITDNVPTYNNLMFNNTTSGSILLPSNSFEVLGKLTIKAGTVNGAASIKTIKLNKDFSNNGVLNANSLSLDIKGSSDQTFSGTGTFNLNNLLLNKTSGGDLYIDATNPVQINGSVSFNTGKLKSTTNGSITFNTGATYSLNSNQQSYATIKVAKVANNETFIFPVGSNYLYRPIESNTAFTGTSSVQYFNSTPNVDNTNDIDLQVNDFEYWKISPCTTNNFTFRWNDANQSPLQGTDMTTLRLARWDTGSGLWTAVTGTTYSGTASSGSITATNLPSGEQMYALAAIQKLAAYCPGESNIYTAPTVSGSGTIVYNWTLTPSNVGKITPDVTSNNQKVTVSFDGTNPNLYDNAQLAVSVMQNGILVRHKTFKLITYPRTPALSLPAYVCANTDVPLQISSQYTRSTWYTDTDSNPASGLTTVQSGTSNIYIFNNNTPTYLNVQGYYTYKDSKGYSYKECPSLLLNPNKYIVPTIVTPGGVYRQANK